MQRPVPPTVGEFGLDEASAKALRRRSFPEISHFGGPLGEADACGLARVLSSGALPAVIFISAMLYVGARILLANASVLLAVSGGIFLGAMLGAVSLAVAWIAIVPLVRIVYLQITRRRCPEFKRLEAFDQAAAEFARERQQYELWEQRTQAEFWRSLDGVTFEREVGRLFAAQGYSVQHTPQTGDGGVDLVLIRGDWKTVVQCKAHAGRIGIGVGRELVASMQDFGAQEAILVAREGVTLVLKEYAEERGIRILELGHVLAMQSGTTTPVTLPAKDHEEMYRRLMRVKRERTRQQKRVTGR
jgi:Holliday junction resolvase